MLGQAEANVRTLRTALESRPVDAGRADAAFKRMTGTCAACHKAYRD